MKKALFLSVIIFLIMNSLVANVSLPAIFHNNMVLQRGANIPVWGWAEIGEKVIVTFDKQKVKATADNNGKWEVQLEPHKAGGPFILVVKGKNELVFKNVLVGDVWICSGQSNMGWTVIKSNNAKQEIANANYSNIRLFTVERSISVAPKDDLTGKETWVECSPETIGDFSAVGYFFGRELNQKYNIPIGLINTSWGGTEIEAWTSLGAIKTVKDFKEEVDVLTKTDLNELAKKEVQFIEDWQTQIRKLDKGYVDNKPVWADKNFDDNEWDLINIPSMWPNNKLKDFDGVVWFRTEFNLSKADVLQGVILNLGPIDDSDKTFLNGKVVGETVNQYSKSRQYIVSNDVLMEGKNSLVVRVEDYRGGGGFSGNSNQLNIETKKDTLLLAKKWKFKVGTDSVPAFPEDMLSSMNPNTLITSLYNTMVNPLIPYAIKGAIWYQGEANATRAYQYRELFPLMITDWRKNWGQGDFPFLWVQLANFLAPDTAPKNDPWPELREAQTMTLSLPNTGMALAIDIGEAQTIHPTNKQDVGKRLAISAYKVAYNEDIVSSGPEYKSFSVNDNKVTITFNNVGSGLSVIDKFGSLGGFAIAGADNKFYYAKAKIISDTTVVVYTEKVAKPVAIRYAWANNPDRATLYNKEGLPAIPFRTDK